MSLEVNIDNIPRTLAYSHGEHGAVLSYVDQRQLPGELVIKQTGEWEEVVDAIKTLAVRGAPAIGVAGAAALALYANNGGVAERFETAAREIATARPTAVNLAWAIRRALDSVQDIPWTNVPQALSRVVDEMIEEDERVNRAIGANGAPLLGHASRILTHCNAGSLATCFYGTALGVVYSAALEGNVKRVFADETRPVGQGARLTVWELSRAGIPVTLICDNMAASLMAKNGVDAVIVGADRIARNGDTANKIGTYGLAVLAKEHGVPFYVAAPFSTIDPDTEDGSSIEIEQRDASEVLAQPLEGVDVWNPAFDVTPARYITAIITERGAFAPSELVRVI